MKMKADFKSATNIFLKRNVILSEKRFLKEKFKWLKTKEDY